MLVQNQSWRQRKSLSCGDCIEGRNIMALVAGGSLITLMGGERLGVIVAMVVAMKVGAKL